MHPEDRLIIGRLLKKHPKILDNYLLNKQLKCPKRILLKLPLKVIGKDIYHRLRLKVKYIFMERKINPNFY